MVRSARSPLHPTVHFDLEFSLFTDNSMGNWQWTSTGVKALKFSDKEGTVIVTKCISYIVIIKIASLE